MIIDAHNHADWHGHNFDAFIANMDKYGIDKTWILSWETPRGEYNEGYANVICGELFDTSENAVPVPFARCLEYKTKAPDRFVLGYAPDPRKEGAVMKLKAAVEIYGVQVCGELKYRMLYNNPDAIDMYKFCGDAGLPVTLHFDYPDATKTGVSYPRPNWWYGGSIDTLEEMLKLCPKTNFLGHAPGFWGHISNDDLAYTTSYPKGPVIRGGKIEQLLEKYPNLYCDISAGSGCKALSRDKDYTYYLMNKFPDRFLYARDYFDNIHQELIESLGLRDDIKELIYHGNAERLISK